MNVDLPQQLRACLAGPLPGPMVGSRFESRPRFGRRYDQCPASTRRAAVLVLLYPHENQWCLPLTLRHAMLSSHAGQISLPGGAIDLDETSMAAAVREFHEELGASDQAIDVLGSLSAIYVGASNFRIEPWVGVTPKRPRLTPNTTEVEAILEVPLAHLLDPATLGCHERTHAGQSYTAPHFLWQSHQIWGATCMVLGELVTVLERAKISP